LGHSDHPAAVSDPLSDMHIDRVFHALLLFAKPDPKAPYPKSRGLKSRHDRATQGR